MLLTEDNDLNDSFLMIFHQETSRPDNNIFEVIKEREKKKSNHNSIQ